MVCVRTDGDLKTKHDALPARRYSPQRWQQQTKHTVSASPKRRTRNSKRHLKKPVSGLSSPVRRFSQCYYPSIDGTFCSPRLSTYGKDCRGNPFSTVLENRASPWNFQENPRRIHYQASRKFELYSESFGKFNVILIVVCGFALYVANFECYSVGYILPAAECELQMDSQKKGILSSSNFMGVMLSCTFWGYLSDIRGRKKLLIMNLLLSMLSSVVGVLIPSFWGLVIFRFINGIFISGPSNITFVYFGEFQRLLYKSKSTSITAYFVALALAALPTFGWLFLESNFGFNLFGMYISSWRVFMMINGIPTILVALAMMALPESPKYLYYSGDSQGALAVLKQMYRVNTGKPESSFPVESLSEKIYLEKSSKAKRGFLEEIGGQIRPLFRMPLLPYTIAASYMQASIFAISAGLFVWYPDIINKLSKNVDSIGMTVCEALSSASSIEEGSSCSETVNSQVFVLNIIIGGAYIVGYVMWGTIVGFMGNKYYFLSCMTVSSVGTFLLLFLTSEIYIDIVFITVLMIPGVCVALLTDWLIDIFPTSICGMAICISLTAGRIGSIIASSILGIMLNFSCVTTFALYAASLAVCLLVALILPKKK